MKEKSTILIVDDSELNRTVLADILGDEYNFIEAENGARAIELLRTHTDIDLILLDMVMPEMNGFEVLELMRSSSVGNSKEIPVIVATASGSCEAEELTAQGFTACLFKPFSLSELIEASEKCLSANTSKEEIPDLASLLAYGDKAAMLDRLITETEKDVQDVRNAGARGDRMALGEWIHRLRSSWAVIHADKPLWELYELLHRENECSEAELQRAVSSILEKGNMIINVAKNERRKLNENLCD